MHSEITSSSEIPDYNPGANQMIHKLQTTCLRLYVYGLLIHFLSSEGIGWAFIGAWALKEKTILIAHLTDILKSIFFETSYMNIADKNKIYEKLSH